MTRRSTRAAIYVTDRKVIFQMIEAAHYQIRQQLTDNSQKPMTDSSSSRTIDLIDTFLDALPQEDSTAEKQDRKPTPADASVDYVSYLLATEGAMAKEDNAPQMNASTSNKDAIRRHSTS